MKPAVLFSLALALCTSAVTAFAQSGLQSNKTVSRAGNWFVVRSTQTTTGTVACTGFYMGHAGVQLSKDRLIINIPGELKSVGLRFDDQPARAPRAPEQIERQMGAVVLAGPDFEQLRRNKTLRLDVTTAQGRSSDTLKLEGLDTMMKNIHADCPVPAVAVRAERAEREKREKAEAARCSPDAVARMRASGMHQLRIASRCPHAAVPAPAAVAASAAPAASAGSRSK